MTPRITLLHGWGYDEALWRKVVPLLEGLEVEVCDLGFFGRTALPAACDAPRIAVGHSLGALWWLCSDLPWRALVAINGFPRFTASEGYAGVAPRILERMQRRFADAPAAVLADFQQACGGGGPALPGDPRPLAEGLETLRRLDARAAWNTRAADIRLLAGRRDAIVPAALSESIGAMLAKRDFRWIDDGGHLLPLTHPGECAQMIRQAARP
ncbi:MAG TPA: alpha/beta fold hydrolase [Rhodocyclaceae bacterium]